MNFARTRPAPIVERRAIAPHSTQAALVLRDLPVPPPRGRDGFRAWRSAAGWAARLQKPRRVRGPVTIAIAVEAGAQTDLSALAAAPIDLLCDLNLIDGDHRAVIREIILRRSDAAGLSIAVRPAP